MRAASALERLAACLTGTAAADPDWMEIVATANEELAGAVLYRRLVQAAPPAGVDPEALEYLETIDAANRERNHRIWTLLHEVVGALNAAGITPLLIKGGAELARRPDPSDVSRILIDLDLVVAPEDLGTAERLLTERGFAPLEETRYDHSPGSFWRRGEVGPVDLHATLPRRIEALLGADGLRHTIPLARDGLRLEIPDASLHLIINVAHDMLHDKSLLSGETRLRYLVDFAEQMTAPELDWDWIAAMRRRHRDFCLAIDLQRLMSRHLLGTGSDPLPKPDATAQLLHRRRLFKLRRRRIGHLEWRLLQRGLRWARSAGLSA